VNDLQLVQFVGRATRFGRRLRSFCRGGRRAAVTDLSPGPPLAAGRHTRTVVVVVLFPQKALDERVPGGRIVLGRAPSPTKARVEPLGLDDEIETRNVGENDAHLFPATFVPSAAVLRPVVVSRRRVDLAVGPADPTGRRRPTAFFTSSATAAAPATLSFFPSRRFAGTPDVRRTRRTTVRRRSVQESVQNGMSAVGRFVAETYRSGRRRRIPQQQFQGRGGHAAATVTFSRPQQARHVHVHPPSAAARRPREVGDQRRVFPQYGGAAGLL